MRRPVNRAAVPAEGFEPSRAFAQQLSRMLCLPVPPRRHARAVGGSTTRCSPLLDPVRLAPTRRTPRTRFVRHGAIRRITRRSISSRRHESVSHAGSQARAHPHDGRAAPHRGRGCGTHGRSHYGGGRAGAGEAGRQDDRLHRTRRHPRPDPGAHSSVPDAVSRSRRRLGTRRLAGEAHLAARSRPHSRLDLLVRYARRCRAAARRDDRHPRHGDGAAHGCGVRSARGCRPARHCGQVPDGRPHSTRRPARGDRHRAPGSGRSV